MILVDFFANEYCMNAIDVRSRNQGMKYMKKFRNDKICKGLFTWQDITFSVVAAIGFSIMYELRG